MIYYYIVGLIFSVLVLYIQLYTLSDSIQWSIGTVALLLLESILVAVTWPLGLFGWTVIGCWLFHLKVKGVIR